MIGIGELAALGTALCWTFATMAWTAVGKRVGSLPTGFIRLLIASCFLSLHGMVVRGLWFPSDETTIWPRGWDVSSVYVPDLQSHVDMNWVAIFYLQPNSPKGLLRIAAGLLVTPFYSALEYGRAAAAGTGFAAQNRNEGENLRGVGLGITLRFPAP